MRRVVITGLGAVTPVGLNRKDSWKAVLEGKSGVGTITQYDVSNSPYKIAAEVKNFDPLVALDAKDAKRMTRFLQLGVAAAKEAVEDSGIEKIEDKETFGCSIGVGIGGIEWTYESSLALAEKGYKRVSPFFIPYVIPNMVAGIVANKFGLKGPNICPATACTSGTHAIGEGLLYIQNEMADVMVCGGAESAISELSISAFGNMKALSGENDNPSEASKPFDLNRSGFVMGEAAGVLVLEELEHAKARGAHIYAELVGYGMSGDAHHITAPSPEGDGAYRCMQMALKRSGALEEEVDYINAHGTSTKLNDLYETMAIKRLLGGQANKVAVSSTKGVTGHCLGAAGGIEGVFTALSVSEQIAPPTANYTTPDPECNLDYVPGSSRKMDIRYAISNSFGFGGTNASIVFKKYMN